MTTPSLCAQFRAQLLDALESQLEATGALSNLYDSILSNQIELSLLPNPSAAYTTLYQTIMQQQMQIPALQSAKALADGHVQEIKDQMRFNKCPGVET